MSNTEDRLLELLKIAWQNECRLKSKLAERDDELEEMYKKAFKILKGEC